MQPSHPKAVLTDMDGLLLDTESVSEVAFHAVAERYKLDEQDSKTIFPRLIGLTPAGHLKIFAETLPKEIDPHAFDSDWKAEFMQKLNQEIPLKAHAKEFLQYLYDKSIPIGLVTSARRAKAELLMERTGLLPYFTAITAGDEVPQGKPAPDIYIEAASRLNVAPEDCLAFEDSANGVRSAHGAGAQVIQVIDLIPPDEELRSLGHVVVSSLAEAAEHLGWSLT